MKKDIHYTYLTFFTNQRCQFYKVDRVFIRNHENKKLLILNNRVIILKNFGLEGCCELVFQTSELPKGYPKVGRKLLLGKKHSKMGLKMRKADCQQKGKIQHLLI